MAVIHRSAGPVALIVLVLLCGLPLRVQAAEFLEFYKLGLAAVEARDWQGALEPLMQAIEKQSEARPRITRSLYFRPYLPHFYLGLARFELGDCQGALAAWQESASQAVVERFAEFERLTEGSLVCRQRLTDLDFAREEAGKVVDSAGQAAATSSRILQVLLAAGWEVSDLATRQRAAESALASAQGRLSAADGNLREIEQAAGQAAEAREQLELVGREARRRQEDLLVRQHQAAESLAAAVGTAREALATSEFLQPFPPGIAALRAQVQELLEHAKYLDPKTGLVEIEAVLQRLGTLIEELDRAAAPPPQELAIAAQAFLDGDYARAIEALEDQESPDTRGAYQARLLRAAALFGLYHTTGASDELLLERAKREVLACRAVESTQPPPPEIFSPSFIAFFEAQ